MSKELEQAIRKWWDALKAHHDVADEAMAQLIESQAWRGGARRLQPVNRKNVAGWRSRGQFPPKDPHLQAAVVQLMDRMALEAGPPEGVGPWVSAVELHQAWLNSRATLEDAPQPKTVEANTRKTQRLDDVLVNHTNRTVEQATSLDGMRQGFWQGSWITDDATPPYVPRDIDDALVESLDALARAGQGGLMVIVGPPKAGKTRTLLEALRSTMPHRRLWQLNAVDGALDATIAAVATDGGRKGPFAPEEVVVLIDDLQRHNFHTTTGVNDKTLSRAISSGLLIVATLHTDTLTQMQAYARDHTRRGDGQTLAIGATPDLIQMLTDARVDLAPQLTATELARVPDVLAGQVAQHDATPPRHSRLPELLAAVDALHERALQGTTDREHPEKAALIHAGIDAHHVYPAGATLSQLEQLTQWAFQHLFPTRHWDPYLFLRAFDWITSPLGGPGSTHAIFLPTVPGGSHYNLFDPLVARLQTGTWDPTPLSPHVDQFTPDACLQIAERSPDEQAIPWLTRASAEIPKAMAYLGDLYRRQKRFDLAEPWYLKAAETDFPDLEMTLLQLGIMYADWERMADAEKWLLQAADLEPGSALLLLGILYGEHGDMAAELHWKTMATRSGDHGMSVYHLGHLHLERGDTELGERCLARLAASNHAEIYYLEARSNTIQELLGSRHAKPLLQHAASLGHPDAMTALADLCEQAGDLDEAASLRSRAAEPTAPMDLLGRGAMHVTRDESEEAKKWLSRAAEQGQPEAMYLLGLEAAKEWLGQQADEPPPAMDPPGVLRPEVEADMWLQRAARLGQPDAMRALAGTYLKRGERELARLWFLNAADHHDLQSIRYLAETAEDPAQAERWWRIGVECYDTESMFGLGRHLHRRGDLDQAEVWLRKAGIRNHPQAMLALGLLHYQRGEETQGEMWLDRAARHQLPVALAIRGTLDWDRGDQEAAQEWWATLAALESDNLGEALQLVGQALMTSGDPDRAELWLLLAAEHEDTEAMQRLSELYEARGDIHKANQWADKAAAARRPE